MSVQSCSVFICIPKPRLQHRIAANAHSYFEAAADVSFIVLGYPQFSAHV